MHIYIQIYVYIYVQVFILHTHIKSLHSSRPPLPDFINIFRGILLFLEEFVAEFPR